MSQGGTTVNRVTNSRISAVSHTNGLGVAATAIWLVEDCVLNPNPGIERADAAAPPNDPPRPSGSDT